jgi:PPM family protein phosphatase
VELLSIGEFARAARLSPKALRLYDELGLLRPETVDPGNGYRRYAPAQLERARLVAWLRMLGMPLADIRTVIELAPGAAAVAVDTYWQRIEAETVEKGKLAADLIEYLSGKDDEMANALAMKYAVRTDVGQVRETNQDYAYASEDVLAVADGFGDRGARASRAAVAALQQQAAPGDLLNAMDDVAQRAEESVQGMEESGSTLTALILRGTRLGLVHIGDSRAYLLRGGELFQITHDDTFVQTLVDEGKLTPEEAASHPKRSMLVKALNGDHRPAVQLRDVQEGDRYLLSSDGLHTLVDLDTVRDVLANEEPQTAVDRLIELANQNGGHDNVSCVVAHLV